MMSLAAQVRKSRASSVERNILWKLAGMLIYGKSYNKSPGVAAPDLPYAHVTSDFEERRA